MLTNLNELINSEYVREKRLSNNVSSFNFSRTAFRKGIWDDITIKARGLFIDMKEKRVKARSYNKFFEINQREDTSFDYIAKNWVFPATAYVKENGYLGICSWEENGELFCASKSTNEGIFAIRFHDLLYKALGDKVKEFSNKLKTENLSAVFEVIDPEYDSHIVKYTEPKVVLLDLIFNEYQDFTFLAKSYDVLCYWGHKFGLTVKEKAVIINNVEELKSFYESVSTSNSPIEGYVVVDSIGNLVKVKTFYYVFWKAMRTARMCMHKDGFNKMAWINRRFAPKYHGMASMVYDWIYDNHFNAEKPMIEVIEEYYNRKV